MAKYPFLILEFVELYLLMPVSLSLLLYDDGQVVFTLFLELSDLYFGFLQLHSHAFHLLPSVADLEEAVAQLVHLLPQFRAFLCQQPETCKNKGQCTYLECSECIYAASESAAKPEGKF